MQVSLIGIVVLRLELLLAPWSTIDPSLFGYLVQCVALADDDGKLSNCEGRLVMQFARYFLYFQLYLYLAYISPGFVLICLYRLWVGSFPTVDRDSSTFNTVRRVRVLRSSPCQSLIRTKSCWVKR